MNENKKRPSKNKDEKILGWWIGTQIKNHKNDKDSMKNPEIKTSWEEFVSDPIYSSYMMNAEQTWYDNLEKVKVFINENKKRPGEKSKNTDEKLLGSWISHQLKNHKNDTYIMKTNLEIKTSWEEFVSDPIYSIYFNNPVSKVSKSQIKKKTIDLPVGPGSCDEETDEETEKEFNEKPRKLARISELHKKYITMTSTNLHDYFQDDSKKWDEYHEIMEKNEESFELQDIPYNIAIKFLNDTPGKKKKVVADLGCGKAKVYNSMKDNPRFTFHNFDHVSIADHIISRDISDTNLNEYSIDIVIMSMCMWGRNCEDFIKEAYRILDEGGRLLIIEPHKRWHNDAGDNRLIEILKRNCFKIKHIDDRRIMTIQCVKH
jgi:hypothetical protein